MTMKTTLQLTALAALVLAATATQMAFATAGAPESSPASTRGMATDQRQLAPFSAIELTGPYHVIIDAQGRQAVSVTGPGKELADVETVVRGDTLVVRPVRRNIVSFRFGPRREEITVHISAATLTRLATSGSGDVELAHAGGAAFAIDSSGPGDLIAGGAVGRLRLASSGSGDVDVRGLKSADADITMHGPGDVLLGEVGATLALAASGAGDFAADRVHVRSAHLRMSGPGEAALIGSADDFTVEISGSGELDAGRLAVRKAGVRDSGPGSVTLATVADTLDAELHGSGDLTAKLAGQRLRLRMDGPGDAQLDGSVAQVDAQLSGSGDLDARRLTAGHADVTVHGPGSASLRVKEGNGPAQLLVVDRSGTRRTAD